MNVISRERLALLPLLAERASAGHIGRTALMKYMYFLQTLRGVPLGYNFSMYSYGPFDPDVLADLGCAEALNIVSVSPVEFSGGYGYRISPGVRAESTKRNAAQFLDEHAKDIDWLFSTFGDLNSGELELTSTIVYVDREFAEERRHAPLADIVARVSEIKPHFGRERVRTFVEDLENKGVLVSFRKLSRAC